MKTDRLDLRYQLTGITAFHCGTGMRLGLIHRSAVRDADNFLVIPGSTIKGVLRDHATALAALLEMPVTYPHDDHSAVQEFAPRQDILSSIFGSRLHPGTLYFDDARMAPDDQKLFQSAPGEKGSNMGQTQPRTRASLSRLTGAARPQALFSSEYGMPTLRFNGRIYGLLHGVPLIDDATVTYSLLLLLAALGAIEALGGEKSIGAGRFTCEVTSFTVNGQDRQVEEYLALLPQFETYELAAEEAHNLAAEKGDNG